jgi:predicted O-methyltransferase YrrM
MSSQAHSLTPKQQWLERYIKATCLYDTNQYQEAGIYYAEILQENPADVLALIMLAVISLKTGDFEKAEMLASAAHRLLPQLKVSEHLLRLIKQKPTNTQQYKGFLDRDFVIGLYKRYLPELANTSVYQDKNRFQDCLTKHIDYDFLYFMVRLIRPKNIIEFSPYHGLSTAHIYTALEANGQGYTFATFDLEEFEGFSKRMLEHHIPIKVIAGDALKTIPEYLRNNRLIGKIDFCFVDSEHTYEFAERYSRSIFPLLSNECVLMFHDMCYCPEQIEEPFNHYGPVKALEITGHCNSFGEGAYLSSYLKVLKGYKFFLTHRLFGGFGLLSPKLPINKELIDDLEREVKGFRYKYSPLPNAEDRKITCMLIAIPEHYCNMLYEALQ